MATSFGTEWCVHYAISNEVFVNTTSLVWMTKQFAAMFHANFCLAHAYLCLPCVGYVFTNRKLTTVCFKW